MLRSALPTSASPADSEHGSSRLAGPDCFSSNGQQCLNCLSHARGQVRSATKYFLHSHNILVACPSTRLVEEVLSTDGITTDQNRRISETVVRERARLRQFIRKRVPDSGDAEDILQ